MVQKDNHYYNILKSKVGDNYDLLLYVANSIIFNVGDEQLANVKSFRSRLVHRSRSILMFFNRFFLFSKPKGKVVISSAYVKLRLPECTICSPPWILGFRNSTLGSYRLSKIISDINLDIESRSLKLIISSSFQRKLVQFEDEFITVLSKSDVRLIILPNDLDLYNILTIRIASKLKIPTMVFLHGLPSRINGIDDNRADYLAVWGKGLKAAFIENGAMPKNILTIKHPFYSDFQISKLKSDLSNVMVISKVTTGTPISSNELVIGDRSKSLLYLELLKQILLDLGIKQARLRLHPSESRKFYECNLPDDFYIIDTSEKADAIKNSSLIIGPTSTFLLDSLKYSLNYILFEPKINNLYLDNNRVLASPFDGQAFIKLSNTVEDFKNNIEYPLSNIDLISLNKYFEIDNMDQALLHEIVDC